jgi:hypothetical protein
MLARMTTIEGSCHCGAVKVGVTRAATEVESGQL